jgi:uncharacterized protein
MDYARPAGQTVSLNGAELIAEPSGALWWGETGTLIVADLHLEKGSSFATGGVMLPPYDTIATLERLAAAIRPELRRVICLGDSFHDPDGPVRLSDADRARLGALTGLADWIWIAGNHDPELPPGIGGRVVADTLRLEPLVFRHMARVLVEPGEISGHYHPKASVVLRGRRFAGPCFAHDGERLVMPAFGAFTGGLDASAPEILSLFGRPPSLLLIARGRIVALG